MDAVRGHCAGGEAEGFAVEGCGVGEGAGGDEEVDVCYAGDHFCWCDGVVGLELVSLIWGI